MQTELAGASNAHRATHSEDQALDLLYVAGVNHRTAPVSVRERLAIPKGAGRELVKRVVDQFGLAELVALSTCNRTEFYWAATHETCPVELFRMLPAVAPQDLDALEPSIYRHQGKPAAAHLFQVACGLDSLVWGETQILHQVKRGYERSREEGYTGPLLNSLFQRAFQTAKNIHTQTRLGSHQASVPSVALELAEAIFGDLAETFVLVVGTGEIAQLTLEAMRKRGATQYAFVSRTAERAQEWREKSGSEIYTLDQLPEVLPRADILVACTSCTEPVITVQHIDHALAERAQQGRPLLILDLGLPRNVAPDAGEREPVFLHNVDDLQAVVAKNQSRQELEAVKAQQILAEGLDEYCHDCRSRTVASVISLIRSQAEQLGQQELKRALGRLPDLTEKEQEELGLLVHRILGKVLHAPTKVLHKASQNGSGPEAVNWAREFFGLPGPGTNPIPGPLPIPEDPENTSHDRR